MFASSKENAGHRGRRFELNWMGLLPVLLDARGAQAGEAVLVNGILPGQEFFDRQRVAGASFFKGKEPATYGCNHLGLAADDPALRCRRRQVRNRKRTAIGPDDIL